ncbi:hypothetical protein A2906_02045 [Candidatus Nomurabacteria bacterium RIFCSPLOWO2_01_FULL_37_25]|nr:MAG: hypothetical protein A2640_02640 [Candidatus Nomurabacteria bacterium RIFCSPHIGHO2_01_FULL_36_23]OGI87792.1 MAG: hypothetical protein A2906_02045 [Candidatus Nomurabacteria bacterium RIFCSPLOWO2_01_FULL_37_25]
MTTITIPKSLIKDDLIIISRRELGRLLAMTQKNKSSSKSLSQLAFEAKAGKNIVGPFSTTRDLFKSLGI